MPTLKEIADDLYATLNINSDDNNIDKRSIYYWIKNKRAMLVRQQLEKRMLESTNLKQSIPCLELVQSDRALSDCCSTVQVGCNVLKSNVQIPNLLSFSGKEILQVRPIDSIQSKFSFVSHDAWIYSGNSRFNHDSIYFTLIDSYLYVKSNKDLRTVLGKYVYLEGVFDDPESLSVINDCNGQACYSDYDEYPIDEWMIDVIKQEILRTDLGINLQSPEDKTNNSDSETRIQER